MNEEENIGEDEPIGHEQLSKNIDDDFVNQLDEVTDIPDPSVKQSTLNTQPNKEDMEVHHHTHPGHHKKKWTDYFWEFLMLFLAVFCGFLAEYQLEHKIEKERGMQYLHSLHIDLQTDIEQCNISIAELTTQTTVLLNMNDCFETLKKDISATTCLNEIISNSVGFKDFIYTDRTIQQ